MYKRQIHDGMSLLYESNKEYLRSIAMYNQYGSLIAAEPVVSQKEDPDVTKQDWFIEAMERVDNINFSTDVYKRQTNHLSTLHI